MIFGYARVSTGSQSEAAQVAALRRHGARKVFREVAQGDRTDRAQLRCLLGQLASSDVLMVTRLDRLARSTRALLSTLAEITGKKAGFRSLADTWADTTTPHGRLMLTVLGGLAEFEKELIRIKLFFDDYIASVGAALVIELAVAGSFPDIARLANPIKKNIDVEPVGMFNNLAPRFFEFRAYYVIPLYERENIRHPLFALRGIFG